MTISIVKPQLVHVDDIARICAEGWKQTVAGILSAKYQKQNIAYWYNPGKVAQDVQAGLYSYIALVSMKVVGVIGGAMKDGSTEIYVLYVDSLYRYLGIGSKLLAALTEQQVAEGAKEQWVSVQEGNQLGIPFYEARGFIYKQKNVTETETSERQVSLRYYRKI
ncbi:GNAT family N-acetyltransferase [Virgibacillus sp. Bac330]|uniref:GNAT family N-acetyltransferase n=1 Tax=Virgibacillus sp. Bac330 TaxID=2419841 RepID=UPI000EF52C4E|nr:GNAT family N-acetyltransferase [Virgibacillus sp. Bac330]